MENYQYENIKKNEIIGQGRHQFIYGYNGENRTRFLRKIEDENPVITNIDKPMAVYVSDFGLPSIEYDKKKIDQGLITILSLEFFNFSTINNILNSYIKNNINEEVDKKIVDLMNNSYDLSAKNIEDIIKEIKNSKSFYENYYKDYLVHGSTSYNIDDIKINFIDLVSYLSQLKKAINNDSYFAFLIDNNKDISIPSTKAINFYIGGRINDTISMKIATEPDKWKSYLDCNGNIIQSLHDYGDVELDDSYKKMLKR